jgi:hypothetical protein
MPYKKVYSNREYREVEFQYVRYVRDDGKIFWGEVEGDWNEVESKINSEAFAFISRDAYGYVSWEVRDTRDR